MKRINNPTDVVLTQYEGEPENTTQEIVLKVAGSLLLPIGLATALREHFSSRERQERIHRVLLAFKADIEALQKKSEQDGVRTKAIEDRLQSPKFTEALLTAAEEAAKTAESKKLDRLASTLANGIDPDVIQPEDDLTSFVRDVSQLSELDIKTLNKIVISSPLRAVFGTPSSSEPSDLMQSLVESAALERIENDDFFSTAFRLVGFGLVLEVPSSQYGARSINHLSFTPTKRGRKLSALLKNRVQATTQ